MRPHSSEMFCLYLSLQEHLAFQREADVGKVVPWWPRLMRTNGSGFLSRKMGHSATLLPQSICARNQQVDGPQSGERGGLWKPEHLLHLQFYYLSSLTGCDAQPSLEPTVPV